MTDNRALDTDIELEQVDAEGVKAGGINASVDGVGSAQGETGQGSASVGGISASGKDDGSTGQVGASGAGMTANSSWENPYQKGKKAAAKTKAKRTKLRKRP